MAAIGTLTFFSTSKKLLVTIFSTSQNQFCTRNILTHCHSFLCFKNSESGNMKTRCVCETLMPPKHPSYEEHDPDI